MEVKDINNNATIQAMFAKAAAGNASGQILGAGFANLVNQLGDLGGSSAKADVVKDADKSQPVDNKASVNSDKVDAKKDKPAKKVRQTVEKDNKPAVRQNERKQAAVDAAPVNVAQNDAAAPEAPKAVEEVVETAPVADVESAPVVQPVENAEPVMRELQASLLGGDAAPIASMNDGEIVLFPGAELNLDTLAQMPAVSVFDDASGEVVTMSGEEFVAKLQQASDDKQLYIAPADADNGQVALQPAEISAKAERDFSSDLQNAMPEQGVEFVDDQLAAQAQVLDNKLGQDKKVRIDVDVRQEEIALADDADLLRDKVAMDEIIRAAVAEGSDETPAKTFDVNSSVSAQPQAKPANVAAQADIQAVPAAVSVNVETQAAVEASANTAVEGISSVSANAHAMGTAATANAAHAEAKAQTSETSFRDIYKGMSKEVVEQVKVNITKSAVKGIDNIDIKLKPEDLGHIQIKMQISKDGKLQAHIVASRPETVEMLQEEVQSLEKAFQDAGFDTDSSSFSFSFSEDAESRGQDKNAELRSFIGNALEQDSAEAGNDNLYGWTAEGGLNIRV